MERSKRLKSLLAAAVALLSVETTFDAQAQAHDPSALPSVRTEHGVVVGTRRDEVSSFKGIPYAAPPVGALRFRPPEAPERWQVPRDAAQFGSQCAQFTMEGALEGSEDCLFLNVYTPARKNRSKRPVMFFIHGGAWSQGSSSQSAPDGTLIYDGEALARKTGAVVVTINYRLGQLGFLAHEAFAQENRRAGSGNYGLADAMLALHWVQRNIRAFGGDPSRTFVFGESAGAYNTCALIAAPRARGLFATAGIQSGGCEAAPRERAFAQARAYADELGCSAAPDVAACLRSLDIITLLGTRPSVITVALGQTVAEQLGTTVWGPVVDGVILPNEPLDLIVRGLHNRVPVLLGMNADELVSFLPPVFDEAQLATAIAGLADNDPQIISEINELYPLSTYEDARQAAVELGTDATFGVEAQQMAELFSRTQPVYRYYFSQPTLGSPDGVPSAFHGAELGYLFRVLQLVGYPPDAPEWSLADAIDGYWYRFAATGNPNGARAPKWPRYNRWTEPYLDLNVHIKRARWLRSNYYTFWQDVL
jgi:para-nitrobenzyl esterase